MKQMKNLVMFGAMVIAMASCQKEAVQLLPEGTKNKVTFKVSCFEQIPFGTETKSGSAQTLEDLCTKLNFAIFDGETKEESDRICFVAKRKRPRRCAKSRSILESLWTVMADGPKNGAYPVRPVM